MGRKSNNKRQHLNVRDSFRLYIHKDTPTLEITIFINEEPVQFYTDPFALLIGSRNTIERSHNFNHSTFELFSCSCGIAGCAGIWDGIYIKTLKRTIQWKIPKDCGYTFLKKPFYNFPINQYEAALKELWQFVQEIPHLLMDDDPDPIGESVEYLKKNLIEEVEYLNSL